MSDVLTGRAHRLGVHRLCMAIGMTLPFDL